MPSTNGNRIGLNSHNSPAKAASAEIQKTMCRSMCMAPFKQCQSVPGAERIHMAHPFGEIEGDREQGQDGDQRHHQLRRHVGIKTKTPLGQYQNGEQDLRERIDFRDHQRPHRHRLADQPGQHEGADDHDVARDDEDDEEDRQRAGDAERNVDRYDQRLVGQGIEIGAELARHVEALGEEAIDAVADPGRQEQEKGDAHPARRDRPDHDRHQQDTSQGNEVRDTQTRPRLRQLFSVLSCNSIYRRPRACAPGDSDVGGAKRSRPARAAIKHLSNLVAFVDEARYAAAGVDIDAGNRMVKLIKPLVRATARAGADAEIGGFGGLFDLKAAGFVDPILVAANDGVGTKVKIAIETGRHDTIGIDLVAMSVNDLVVQGAEPLFFLDYFACGKLDPAVGAQVVKGIAAACREAGCALIGGETAEMPGLYAPGDYDLAGFAVGAVGRADLLPRADIAAGDVVIGVASTGVHSNGFSLVRRVAATAGLTWEKQAPFDPSRTLGEALLTPTRLYVRSCLAAIRQTKAVKALAHITGGGFVDNIPRVLPDGLAVTLDLDRVPVLPVFKWLAASGKITEAEMLRTFNCGIGMVAVLERNAAEAASERFSAQGETVVALGEVVAAKDGARVGFRGHLDLAWPSA